VIATKKRLADGLYPPILTTGYNRSHLTSNLVRRVSYSK